MNQASPTWSKVQSLFQRAVELSTAQRSGFLQSECGGDETLRHEVESLLASYEPGEAALATPPIHALLEDQSRSTRAVPNVVEGYEILQEISRGGQGVVYKAYQRSTRRHVAIKFLLQGPFTSFEGKERFEREVELVSGLTHPGIVPIYDSGLAQDRYYYVMEFIDGQRLDKFVADRRLAVRQIVSLFVKVCDAVNHAQQNGVIHRDLKPSNILVDAVGQPHILDFGLAKSRSAGIHDALTVSLTGQVMGTLQYMSPEQATGHTCDVDIRSDVYSLGVVLYELLTGQLPYNLDSTLTDNLKAIRDAPPNRHMLRETGIGSELATIVLKALHKEPIRRYQTAGALSEDLDRFLDGKAIAAKRDSTLYLVSKVLRRHLAATVLTCATIGIVFASALVAGSLYLTADRARTREAAASVEARRERDNAEVLRDQSDQQLYFAEMNLAGQAVGTLGGIRRVREVISHWDHGSSAVDRRGWEWYYLSSLCDREVFSLDHGSKVWSIAWHPQKDELAFGDEHGQVSFWTPGQRSVPFTRINSQIRAVTYNRDGSALAASGPAADVAVWDTGNGDTLLRFPADDHVLTLAWHPHDPHVLAAGSIDGVVQVWDILAGRQTSLLRHKHGVQTIDWHPEGDRLVVGTHDKFLHFWNVEAASIINTVGHFPGVVFGVRYDRDGESLVACDAAGCVARLDDSGRQFWKQNTELSKWCVCWGPHEDRVATVGKDRSLRLWSARKGYQTVKYDGHHDAVWSLAWDHKSSRIATGSHDGTIKVWNPDEDWSSRVLDPQPDTRLFIESLAWSPDGRTIAVAANASDVLLIDSESGRAVADMKGHTNMLRSLVWSADGSMLVSSGFDETAIVWDARAFTHQYRFDGHVGAPTHVRANVVNALDLSADGQRVVSGSHNGTVRVWHASTGRVEATLSTEQIVYGAAWQPGTQLIAVISSLVPGVIFWQPDSDKQQIVGDYPGELRALDWSPDGERLAVGNDQGTVWIVDSASKRVIHMLNEHVGTVRSIAWSPDGSRVATASEDKTVRIWDPMTGRQSLVLEGHEREVHTVTWSPDGRQLASAGWRGLVRIWDARAGYDRTRSDGKP